MNVRILRHFFRYCERYEVEPSFKSLHAFNKLAKGLNIPK